MPPPIIPGGGWSAKSVRVATASGGIVQLLSSDVGNTVGVNTSSGTVLVEPVSGGWLGPITIWDQTGEAYLHAVSFNGVIPPETEAPTVIIDTAGGVVTITSNGVLYGAN